LEGISVARALQESPAEWLRSLWLDLVIASRNVIRQKRRSAFGITAVSFGIVAMILAGGCIEWILWATREATIKGGLGHIQIVRPGLFEGGLADPLSFLVPERSKQRTEVEALPGVIAVGATLSFSGLVSHGDSTISFTGEGVDAAVESIFISVEIVDGGQSLSPDDPTGIVMGRGLAANLGVGVGDTVILLATTTSGGVNAVEVRIRGLFFTVSKAYDDVAVRLPLPLAQQLLRTSQVHRWIVVLDDTSNTARVLNAIDQRLGSAGFELVPWYRLAGFYNKAAGLLSRQVTVLNIIIALIIMLSISNTLTMNVMERTGEIGTIMALGVPRGTVLRRFLSEGAVVGMLGGALGCAVGVALAIAISAKGIPMPPPPGRSEGYLGKIMVNWGLVLSALLLALITTLFAGLYPAWKASRLVIVDALRHNR